MPAGGGQGRSGAAAAKPESFKNCAILRLHANALRPALMLASTSGPERLRLVLVRARSPIVQLSLLNLPEAQSA